MPPLQWQGWAGMTQMQLQMQQAALPDICLHISLQLSTRRVIHDAVACLELLPVGYPGLQPQFRQQ